MEKIINIHKIFELGLRACNNFKRPISRFVSRKPYINILVYSWQKELLIGFDISTINSDEFYYVEGFPFYMKKIYLYFNPMSIGIDKYIFSNEEINQKFCVRNMVNFFSSIFERDTLLRVHPDCSTTILYKEEEEIDIFYKKMLGTLNTFFYKLEKCNIKSGTIINPEKDFIQN